MLPRAFFERTLLAPSSARELAMARVVVALVWLLSEDVHRAAEGAAIPAALRAFPLGTAWASSLVTPGAASVAYVVVLVAAALALVGWQTRFALAALALFGTYLLGVGQLRGAVLHDHHLVWLAALLAASPAGDALSADAWLAARAGRPPLASRPSARYGAPLRFAWLLIACVYFFPGLHKLSVSGLGWIFSDNLRNQLWLKWAETEGAFVPLARIDRHPTMLRIGALGVVLLELGFGPMVLANRTTRAIAVTLAFLFHQATAAFLAIRYETLWVCLAIFLPWDRVLRNAGSAARDVEEPAARSTLVVGTALVVAVSIAGFAGAHEAWPFAAYPAFEHVASDRLPDLGIEVVDARGQVHLAPRELVIPERGQARYRVVFGILRRRDPVAFAALLDRATTRLRAAGRLEGARRIRLVELTRNADPDRRGDPPLAQRTLYEREL